MKIKGILNLNILCLNNNSNSINNNDQKHFLSFIFGCLFIKQFIIKSDIIKFPLIFLLNNMCLGLGVS